MVVPDDGHPHCRLDCAVQSPISSIEDSTGEHLNHTPAPSPNVHQLYEPSRARVIARNVPKRRVDLLGQPGVAYIRLYPRITVGG